MSKKARSNEAGDPQCRRLYKWEESWVQWNYNLISLDECRAFIEYACKHYGSQTPRVTSHVGSLSFFDPNSYSISMQGGRHNAKGGRNIATAMHEAAHVIIWNSRPMRIQDHGRAFLRVYLDLLARAGVAPLTALEASAKAFGLRWR